MAQARAATPDAAWSANWIGPETTSLNQWTRYLLSFDLAEVPPQARARIAVDSKYWLWLNGELLVREGGLKRGPTPAGTYFDVVDLAPALRKGSNTLAILVWHFGQHGFSHNSSGASGLVFELDLPGGPLFSDTAWRISPHAAISTSPDTPPNRRLAESSLRFDARNDELAWIKPGFDASAWSAPKTFGVPPVAPWGPLTARPIPQWKDYGLLDFPSVSKPLPSRGGTITARLPYNAQINPWIKVNAPAGREIDIRTDNFMGGSQPNIHAKYVTRDGIQEFEAFGWMNGHEVIYTVPEDVEILGVKFRETGYDASFTGSFTCDDPDLDTLWTKAARTLYINMRDTYMDCPDRERSQWWGDVVNQLGQVPYTFDPRAHQLTRKAIRELVDWQRPDGILYSPVPAGLSRKGSRRGPHDRTWYWELPVQMLASVGKYGFWTYYMQTADKETIAHAYPAVRSYLDIWQLDDRGLVIHRRGDWDWLDWGKDIDAPLLVNAWFVLALEGAIEMAHLSGNDADVPRWQALRERVAAAYNTTFWTGKEYRSPGYSGDTDDRGNAMAVLAGFAEPGQFPALIQILTKHRNASQWMEKYVLEALYHMNAPDLAKQRMKERYRRQIESPLTTLWEGWEIGRHDYGGGTYNHAWSGGPLTCLSQFAAGIAPSAPSFAAFTVLPQMGSLKRISAKVDSPRGVIEAELTRTDSSFTARVTSPPGTEGLIGVPRPAAGTPSFTIDGKPATTERSTARHHLFRLPTVISRIVAEWRIQRDQPRTSPRP
jgi:alpha-L-rhamnosidase